MRNLIPPFIHAQYQAHRRRGEFEAVSLFVDISRYPTDGSPHAIP